MSKSIQKILLVDDEVEFSKTIQRHLKREGFSSDLACNSNDARRKIQDAFHNEIPFQLVITEVMRPTNTGVELLQWIKRTHPEVSVLLLTSFHGTELVRKNIRPEMDAYGDKPLTPREMMVLIYTIDRKRDSHFSSTPLSPIH